MDPSTLDVDDLFADDLLGDAQFEVPLASHKVGLLPNQSLIPSGLVQHLTNLQQFGCCQRIAWSRQGAVVFLTPDSLRVSIQCLRFSKKDGVWVLSKPSDLFTDDYLFPITHIQWSVTGVDLAVVDLAGRIGISTFAPNAVNRMIEVRGATLDAPDELNQVVAMFWLNQDRPREAVLHSSKDESRWIHVMAKRKPHGPYFPRAMAVVTRKGFLRLIFQRPDSKWAEASTVIQPFDSPTEYLTHAAFAPTIENRLLVTTYTCDQKLSVYSVGLVWPGPEGLRGDPNAEFVPVFEVEVIKNDVPNPTLDPSIGVSSMFPDENYGSETWNLTHLEIIPSSDIEKTLHLSPTIIGVYTCIDNSVDVTSPGFLSSSLIRRWNVQAVEQKLHPRFDEAAASNPTTNSTSPKPKIDVLKTQPDIRFSQIITSFEQVEAGQSLAITTHDGTTTFWRADTMAQSFLEHGPTEATSLSQSGFVFELNPNPLQLAFSPNACQCASLDPDGTPHITMMQFHQTGETSSDDFDVALAAIVLTFARAAHSSANTDDLVACITLNLRHTPAQITQLLTHCYRSLFREGELLPSDVPGSDIANAHIKAMIPKVLSLHAALGFLHENNGQLTMMQRNTPARFAWITLHIRHTCILFYFLMSIAKNHNQQNQNQNQNQNTTYPHDFVDLLCGHARWLLDLFKWMMDVLLEAGYREESPGFLPDATPESEAELELVTMLLTGVWPRYFLKLTLKLIRMVASPPLGAGGGPFVRIAGVVGRSVVQGLSWEGVERMLDGMNVGAGARPTWDRLQRANEEALMMAAGRIPEVYRAAVRRFMEVVVPEMRRAGEFQRLGLWGCRGGLGWVGLEDGLGGMVDVHRKVVVKRYKEGDGEGENMRVCVRCAGVVEDLAFGRDWSRVLLQYMARQFSRCVCESGWLLEGR